MPTITDIEKTKMESIHFDSWWHRIQLPNNAEIISNLEPKLKKERPERLLKNSATMYVCICVCVCFGPIGYVFL